MIDTAEDLAARLDGVTGEVLAFARACNHEQWGALVPGEEWSVGVVVHHIAVGYKLALGWINVVPRGEAIDDTSEDIDILNVGHAKDFVDIGIEETVVVLIRNSAQAAAFIRSLDNSQWERAVSFGPAGGRAFTTANWPKRSSVMLAGISIVPSRHSVSLLVSEETHCLATTVREGQALWRECRHQVRQLSDPELPRRGLLRIGWPAG